MDAPVVRSDVVHLTLRSSRRDVALALALEDAESWVTDVFVCAETLGGPPQGLDARRA